MEIIAKILEYLMDDLHFDYEDGITEWFDATKFQIIEPISHKNTIFYIYHNYPQLNESIWRKKESTVKLMINNRIDSIEMLKNDIYFSDGAIIAEIN